MASAGVLLLLGLLLSSASSLPPPRTSFLLDSATRPLLRFSQPGVHNTTTLLLSDDESTLYVGAQDAILSLDVSKSDSISLKNKVEWSPSEDNIKDCQDKGKNPTVDCPNFVQVLQPLNSTHLYACGSYAYSPHDAYIDAESFSIVNRDGAKGRCPFSPFERNAAVTIDGELFTATTADFRGVKPQISRHFSKTGRPDIHLDSSVSLLEEPKFVGSSLDRADNKLYFFFSEVGKEFSFVDDLRIARVAQICKDDIGGKRTLQKKWTSFAKAPLLCQSPKQLPFNILQDVFTLQPSEGSDSSETLFYGVFTSQWSTGPESAVCVFKLQDIREVFAGSYRTFDMENHQWRPLTETHSYLGKCGLDSSSDSELMEVKKSFLTSGSVRPVGGGPILSSGQQYKRVAVMRTQAADGKQYTVLFLLTESGFLHKVGLFDRGPRVIEEIQVFTQPQPVQSIVLSSAKGVVYVGTSDGVTAVPVASCSIYSTCSQCVLARDPLCGWSRTSKLCTRLDSGHENIVQNLEDGNVGEECQREADAPVERRVHLNQVVRLQCQKPSNLAALSWTSPQFRDLSKELFIRSADGSLSFFAADNTFGTYRCEAEEGGYKEVVVSYDVRPIVTPRTKNPEPEDDEQPEHESKDESYEDIATGQTVTSVAQPSADSEDSDAKDKKATFTTTLKDETDSNKKELPAENDNGSDIKVPSKTNTPSSQEGVKERSKEKSYYSELVGVSILLAICICILMLGLFRVWRQRKPGLKLGRLVSPEDDGKTNKSMEICTLSSPEDAAPELKVVY